MKAEVPPLRQLRSLSLAITGGERKLGRDQELIKIPEHQGKSNFSPRQGRSATMVVKDGNLTPGLDTSGFVHLKIWKP